VKRVSAGVLYACKGAHTHFTGTRERESAREGERERERERERGRERERERERESKKEGERERCRICPELLFLFVKGMMGASAPFKLSSLLIVSATKKKSLITLTSAQIFEIGGL
jgi:hypothetical protein